MARAKSVSALFPASLVILAVLVGKATGGEVEVSTTSEEPWSGRVGPWEETSELELKVEEPESRSGLGFLEGDTDRSGVPTSSEVEQVLKADPENLFKISVFVDHVKELSRSHEEVNEIIKATYLKSRNTMVADKRAGKVGKRFWTTLISGAIGLIPSVIPSVVGLFKSDTPAATQAPAPAPAPVQAQQAQTMPNPNPQQQQYPIQPPMPDCESVMICRSKQNAFANEQQTPVKSRSGRQKSALRNGRARSHGRSSTRSGFSRPSRPMEFSRDNVVLDTLDAIFEFLMKPKAGSSRINFGTYPELMDFTPARSGGASLYARPPVNRPLSYDEF